LLYRRCLMRGNKTVDLPNGDLKALGISRQTKYRALAQLESAGGLTVETRNGRSVRVTLHWFP
jgi:CTP-dependent riboflavin kinase